MALGATVTAVVRSVVMPGVWLALAGIVVGSALALALARVAGLLIAILVWGVSPTDPWTFAAAGALLLAVAAVASLLPALRLARRNPIDTLRE